MIELQPRRREASYFVEYILQTYLIPGSATSKFMQADCGFTRRSTRLAAGREQAVISLLPAGTPDAKGLHQPQAALVSRILRLVTSWRWSGRGRISLTVRRARAPT